MTSPRTAILFVTLAVASLAADAGTKDDAARNPTAGDAGPSCLRCGSTCGLEPICVCEPGIKKVPRAEYDVACEPICIAGCGSKPWCGRGCTEAGCTTCGPDGDDCPGRVRSRKTLRRETVEDEVCVVNRRVAYLCDACSRSGVTGCTAPGRGGSHPETRPGCTLWDALCWPWRGSSAR